MWTDPRLAPDRPEAQMSDRVISMRFKALGEVFAGAVTKGVDAVFEGERVALADDAVRDE